MKSFKDYLTESKKTYDFKIKVAGDCPKDCAKKIKEALSVYKVESCSSGKGLPIAETYADFPEQKNIGVTVFDVCISYPANSQQVRAAVADKLCCASDKVKVRNMKEEEEDKLNHQHDEKSGESLLAKEYDASADGQSLVGEKHTMSLLKELGKNKKTTEQYTGVNDALLAKSTPKGTATVDKVKVNTKSPVGSSKVKLPTAKTAGAK